MTKKELLSKIPSAKFSGKNKIVYVKQFLLNYIQIEILKDFCAKTGYSYI